MPFVMTICVAIVAAWPYPQQRKATLPTAIPLLLTQKQPLALTRKAYSCYILKLHQEMQMLNTLNFLLDAHERKKEEESKGYGVKNGNTTSSVVTFGV